MVSRSYSNELVAWTKMAIGIVDCVLTDEHQLYNCENFLLP